MKNKITSKLYSNEDQIRINYLELHLEDLRTKSDEIDIQIIDTIKLIREIDDKY